MIRKQFKKLKAHASNQAELFLKHLYKPARPNETSIDAIIDAEFVRVRALRPTTESEHTEVQVVAELLTRLSKEEWDTVNVKFFSTLDQTVRTNHETARLLMVNPKTIYNRLQSAYTKMREPVRESL